MTDDVRRQLAQQEEYRVRDRETHEYIGRSDRRCEAIVGTDHGPCGLPDRHPVHTRHPVTEEYRVRDTDAAGIELDVAREPRSILDGLWDEMYRAIRINRDGQLMISLRERIEAEAARGFAALKAALEDIAYHAPMGPGAECVWCLGDTGGHEYLCAAMRAARALAAEPSDG